MTAEDEGRLEATRNQRNAAFNECAEIAAQLWAAKRKIAELEAKLKEAENKPADAPNGTNGHAKEEQPASPPC